MSGRFAIYYTPARDSALTAAAESWLGCSAWTGEAVARPKVRAISAEMLARLTTAPARYGFHATLKAPMRLRAATNAGTFFKAVGKFAESSQPVEIDLLKLQWIGPFLALVPEVQSDELMSMAEQVVRQFDRFRAPPDEAELRKRRSSGLSQNQERLLMQWGYPYVMEEFRFHMTLTGPVDHAIRADVEVAAHRHFSRWLGRPLEIDRVAVFHEPEPERNFMVARSFAMREAGKRSPEGQSPDDA